MPLQTSFAPSESLPAVMRPDRLVSDEPVHAILAAVLAVREELSAAALLNAVASSDGLKYALGKLANAILKHPRANRRDGWVSEVLGVIKETGLAGVHDLPADRSSVTSANAAFSAGWPGVLAGMLQVGAGELEHTPTLDSIPDWLWADYAGWVFNAQPRFALTRADRSLTSAVQRAREVESWLARNVGSLTTRAAAEALLRRENTIESGVGSAGWRELAHARGKVLTKLFGTDRATFEPMVKPRHGRRLRLGFVSNNFGPSPELLRTFPYFEQINPAAFEVFLFPLATSDAPEATYCTGSDRVAGTHLLPVGTVARVAFLREAQLDALVFVGDLLGTPNDLTEIALHRVAPLQVVNDWSGTTTGLPEIDLAVSAADLNEQLVASFTERVGVLRGPAVNVSAALANMDVSHLSRSELGLPEGSPLMVACVDVGGASNAQLQAWAQMLAFVPTAHLAVAFLYEGETSLLSRFCSALDRVLQAQHVGRDRIHIFPAAPTRPREARGLIALSDIFLDANAGPAASWACVEALRLGIPTIALGTDVSASASLLKSLGLAHWVAADAAAYVQIAANLMGEPERLKVLKAELTARVEAVPAFLDSLAASDAFGALIEATFDELASLGHSEFRQQAETVRCFGIEDLAEVIEVGLVAHAQGDLDTAASQASLAMRSAPGDVRARQLFGVVLHAQGNMVRAIEYLLAAVQQSEATAATWYSLALALRDNGQTGEAIQALETCIRLDHRHVEALLTILELAEQVGATDIARDVLDSLKLVAPDDSRVLAMS